MNRLTGRKWTNFIVTQVTLISLYVLTLFVYPNVLAGLGFSFILLIFANGTVFVAFNSLDKWISLIERIKGPKG